MKKTWIKKIQFFFSRSFTVTISIWHDQLHPGNLQHFRFERPALTSNMMRIESLNMYTWVLVFMDSKYFVSCTDSRYCDNFFFRSISSTKWIWQILNTYGTFFILHWCLKNHETRIPSLKKFFGDGCVVKNVM